MYSETQGDRPGWQIVHMPGDSRTEIAPRPIIIIMSDNVAPLVSYILEDEGHPTIAANDIPCRTTSRSTFPA